MQDEIEPANKLAHLQLPDDATRWQTIIPVLAEVKEKAKKQGLWNLFLSKSHYPQYGVPLTNLEVRSIRSSVHSLGMHILLGCLTDSLSVV